MAGGRSDKEEFGAVNAQVVGSVDLSTYKLSDYDNENDPEYYGYLNQSGGWILQKITDATGSVLYAHGSSGYDWANRADPGTIYQIYSTEF